MPKQNIFLINMKSVGKIHTQFNQTNTKKIIQVAQYFWVRYNFSTAREPKTHVEKFESKIWVHICKNTQAFK
jgi:hypothetical protein